MASLACGIVTLDAVLFSWKYAISGDGVNFKCICKYLLKLCDIERKPYLFNTVPTTYICMYVAAVMQILLEGYKDLGTCLYVHATTPHPQTSSHQYRCMMTRSKQHNKARDS